MWEKILIDYPTDLLAMKYAHLFISSSVIQSESATVDQVIKEYTPVTIG